MPIDWSPFVELVQKHTHFLLTTHVRPDGDGLGSIFALTETLRSLGKQVQIVIASRFPPRYQFIDPQSEIIRYESPDAHAKTEVIIVMDTGTWNQLGDFGDYMRSFDGPKLVIDHHMTQDDLGAIQLVDTAAEATGRLSFEAIESLKASLTPSAASNIFIALAMDTGWFRHQNTTPRTLELAKQLVEAGANPTRLYEQLFEQKSLGKLRLTGLMLNRLQVAGDGKISYSEIHRDDYAQVNALPADSEDLIDMIKSVAGVEVALFFMEQPAGGVKISFRSRERIDVAQIAEQFGGGGHRLASGAVIHADIADAKQQVIRAVEAALNP